MLAVLLSFSGCGSQKEDDPVSVPGTWYTASMGYEYYGQSQAEYYARFTDSIIEYGHMKDDEFIPEYTDKIVSIEMIGPDRYRILAETSGGKQYSYQTNADDTDVLEYHGTWNEEDFSKTYSAGASLWKSSTN